MPSRDFVVVRIELSEAERELLYGYLARLPISGIEETPEELRIYLPQDSWSTAKQLLQALGLSTLRLHGVEHARTQDWYAEWLKQLQPVWLTPSVVVHPFPTPPSPSEYPGADLIVHIVPGMAFGTGHHATTRLTAAMLLKYIGPGQRWLDAGTGTGILAIVAAKAGASEVVAIENNPFALEQAQENLRLNAVESIVRLWEADLEELEPRMLGRFEGIVANLTHNLLIKLRERFTLLLHTGGLLILSGVLVEQLPELLNRYTEPRHFEVREVVSEDEWSCAVLQRT